MTETARTTRTPGGGVAPETVRAAVVAHGDNPSAFLALNGGNAYFTGEGLDGVIAYRRSGRFLVQFGGPFAAAADAPVLLRRFVAFAAAQRRAVVSVQVQSSDLPHYLEQGFTVNQVGSSWAVDLERHTLRGKRFMQLRNKISRAHRAGLEVTEVEYGQVAGQVVALDGIWLRGKGKHAKPLEFLVGEHGGPMQPHRRLFAGRIDGELAGYVSYSPVPGSRPGWLHDLSRRLPDGPPGVMEAINKTAIDAFRAEGVPWLHFGFTPFTGLDRALDPEGASGWFRWVANQLAVRGEAVYPARTQLAYKQKWDPVPIPEYVAFSRRASVSGFLQVFRAANAL